MAKRYPAASWEPLGVQTEPRMRSHDIICLHTMVGSLAGTAAMFGGDGYGGTESHFGTGGAGEKVKQWQDLAFTADANLDGNPRVISIENADKGPGFSSWSGSDVPGFTGKQLDQLVDLVAWLCSKEAHADCPSTWTCHQVGIPAALVPDSRPGRRGIAYHRQGIDGSLPDMRVLGGELWSSSRGKICPGDRRVKQIREDLVPRVGAVLKPKHAAILRVMTANLGRGVGPARFTLNAQRISAWKAVKGFQEIDEADTPDEHAILEREMPPSWAAFDTKVPIHVPAPWRIVETRITHGCDGLAKFTPARKITQALIELLRADAPPMRLVIVNGHAPIRRLQTVSRRRQFRRALQAVIAHWHDQGYTVVWMGDMNQRRMRKQHPLERQVVNADPDKIRVVPHTQGVQVEVLRTREIDLNIDRHNGHLAKLRLTPPKET